MSGVLKPKGYMEEVVSLLGLPKTSFLRAVEGRSAEGRPADFCMSVASRGAGRRMLLSLGCFLCWSIIRSVAFGRRGPAPSSSAPVRFLGQEERGGGLGRRTANAAEGDALGIRLSADDSAAVRAPRARSACGHA